MTSLFATTQTPSTPRPGRITRLLRRLFPSRADRQAAAEAREAEALAARRLADKLRAQAIYAAAKARYDDAVDRGDSRAMHETWAPMKRAQLLRLRMGA